MASTLYRSGSIYTPGTPRATAMLIHSDSGRVVWVGTDEAATRLADPDLEVDLRGALVAPAFVDAWVESATPGLLAGAVRQGIGTVHVIGESRPGSPRGGGGVGVVTYPAVADLGRLSERFREDTEAGRQSLAVLEARNDLRWALARAAEVAEATGVPRFVAARHRLQARPGALGAARDADIAELARLGLVLTVQPAADPLELPLRRLAGAGVPFAFGSGSPSAEDTPWAVVRAASVAPRDEAVSVRSAFAAATRGGHRAARRDGVGELRAGAPATFAVWKYEGELVVRTPDSRVAAWSTDPRAATPGLPDLSARTAEPRCLRTVVDGAVVFDAGIGLGADG